jgi:hypothetical protein
MRVQSEINYFFSMKMFIITSLFVMPSTIALSYLTLQFLDQRWICLTFAIPLLLFLSILPEYLKTFYFLIRDKPAIIVTKNSLLDNFNQKEYKWSDISRIEYKPNKRGTPGGHTAVYFKKSEKLIRIPDIKLQCKRSDFINTLIDFHRQYDSHKLTC